MDTRPQFDWIPPALVVLAGLSAVLPYRELLGVYPVGDDVTLWVKSLDAGDEGWLRRTLFQNHFIAYRPVAALSFAANSLFPGAMPWGIRATDIALHALVGFGVYEVWRALSNQPRSWWGVLAAATFWASPLNELIVPFVTRRSYSLATGFGLAALALTLAGIRRRRFGLTAAGAFCLFLAALSNETAFVMGPVLVLACAAWAQSWREAALHGGSAIAAAAVAAGLRWAVMGGLGGYGPKAVMVSVVEDGERSILHDPSPAALFAYAWRGAVLPDNLAGEPMFLLAFGGASIIGGAGAVWALGWSAFRLVRRSDPVPTLLAVWALGYAFLAVLAHIWFPRMSYPMGAPVALWLVWAAKHSLEGHARWNLLPLGLIFAARAGTATFLAPLDHRGLEEQFQGSRAIRQATRALRRLDAPALVWMGTSLPGGAGRSVTHLVGKVASPRIELRQLTFVPLAEPDAARVTVVTDGTSATLADGARWTRPVRALDDAGSANEIPLTALQVDQRPTWILDAGALTRVSPTP